MRSFLNPWMNFTFKEARTITKLKKVKRELRDRYAYVHSTSADMQCEKNFKEEDVPQFIAVLTAGCVQIEALVLMTDGEKRLICNVFVKDEPNSREWIHFCSLNPPKRVNERTLFEILDQVVTENDLSYTECCFEKLSGSMEIAKQKI